MHRALFSLSALFLCACATQAPHRAASQTSESNDGRNHLSLAPCIVPKREGSPAGGADYHGLCGTFTVPENRLSANSRMLDLHVIIVPARSGKSTIPIFVLAGGPGQAA